MVIDIVRVGLGLVMLAAGIGKLSNRSWPAQAIELGAPTRIVPVVAPVELLLGAALAANFAGRVAAALTALLLAAFTALLISRLRRGEHPPCACFGGRRPRPINKWSVARNAGLIVIAAVVVGL